MAISKPKTVEITLRVRVPKNWTAAHTKRELANAWYGQIYALGPAKPDDSGWRDEVSLFPTYGKARIVEGS